MRYQDVFIYRYQNDFIYTSYTIQIFYFPPHITAVDDGLGGGAVFGIIVAVLVLVAAIGALSWFIIIPYVKDNNLLDRLPFVGASSSSSSSTAQPGFDNMNYANA